jgi:hypothetical protein
VFHAQTVRDVVAMNHTNCFADASSCELFSATQAVINAKPEPNALSGWPLTATSCDAY